MSIYLISPPKFNLRDFSKDLKSALTTGLVPMFQLRVKDSTQGEIIKTTSELKKICSDFNCKFILNDYLDIALEFELDGVHLGGDDDAILAARAKSPKDFIIGASCYDSKELAKKAIQDKASYISFGTFFPSITKNSSGKPTPEILTWAKSFANMPVVAIGGITDQNCTPLIKAGADSIAVVSFVWQHPQGVEVALNELNNATKQSRLN